MSYYDFKKNKRIFHINRKVTSKITINNKINIVLISIKILKIIIEHIEYLSIEM